MRIAIVAAMPGEIAPLTHTWQRFWLATQSDRFRAWRHADAIAVAGRMGCDSAALATRAAIALHQPDLIISAGWAGALEESLKVGNVVVPASVIHADSGEQFATLTGGGTLISSDNISGAESKDRLWRAHRALAVDMEAAGVARVARERNIPFLAIKSISDERGVPLPELDAFRDPRGGFRYSRFIFHLAIRPALWPAVRGLARSARISAVSLSRALKAVVDASASGTLETVASEVIRLSFTVAGGVASGDS